VKWNDELAYFFKGDKVVVYNMKTDVASIPVPYAGLFPFLAGKSSRWDAVIRSGNLAYFVVDYMAFAMDVSTLKASGGVPLNRQFPGLSFTRIDATLNKNNEFIYLFHGNQYARFNIKKDSVDAGYPQSVGAWAGIADEYWSAKTAYADKNREFTVTFDNPREVRRAEPIGEPAYIGDFKEKTQLLRLPAVEKYTRQAYRARPTFFKFNLKPVVVRKKDDVVVSLTDTTDFNNACYAKENHWCGYFLDSVNITYRNLTPNGWTSPIYGPRTINNAGGYNTETGWSVNASLGFDGKAPNGSVAGGWSQSKGSSTSIQDVEFKSNAPDGTPVFTWNVAQMYDGEDRPVAIKGDWWNGLRKTAAQVDLNHSVYEAPKLVQTSFVPVSYVFYHPSSTNALPTVSAQDMRILVEYDVAYRAIHTRSAAKNDGDAFLRGFSLVFGLAPGTGTGEALRQWATSVVRHKYAIEVVIPKEHLQPSP
jgi:hypothetical protein